MKNLKVLIIIILFFLSFLSIVAAHFDVTPDEAGKYVVVVWAKDDASGSDSDVMLIGTTVDISEPGEEPYFPF